MRGIEPGRPSYHPSPRGRAIDWIPERPMLEREVAPGLTLAEFLELSGELCREPVTLEAEPVPGEPTAYRAVGTFEHPVALPYDWPWLRLDELWYVLHRYGRYATSVKVATLDRDKAARAGL